PRRLLRLQLLRARGADDHGAARAHLPDDRDAAIRAVHGRRDGADLRWHTGGHGRAAGDVLRRRWALPRRLGRLFLALRCEARPRGDSEAEGAGVTWGA